MKTDLPHRLLLQTRVGRLSVLLLMLLFVRLAGKQSAKPQLHAQARELNPVIRVQLWVPTEGDPSHQETAQEDEAPYMPAVRSLRNIAPFMLEGMIYGWDVCYTPSDAARHVAEYYECTPIREITLDDPAIQWKESEITDTDTSCWIDYTRSDTQIQYKKWWDSVNIAKVQGKGTASVELGSEGIKQAVIDAVKVAIRAYLQKTEKNKPKEMTGSILLAAESPHIYIDHGQYVADLDFFLYVDRIEQYSYY